MGDMYFVKWESWEEGIESFWWNALSVYLDVFYRSDDSLLHSDKKNVCLPGVDDLSKDLSFCYSIELAALVGMTGPKTNLKEGMLRYNHEVLSLLNKIHETDPIFAERLLTIAIRGWFAQDEQ